MCPAFDHYLTTTFDTDIIPLVEEILGWCLIPTRRFEQAVMLQGEGENGKSVFLDLVGYLLGACPRKKSLKNNVLKLRRDDFKISHFQETRVLTGGQNFCTFLKNC